MSFEIVNSSCRMCRNWYTGDETRFTGKNHIHLVLIDKEGKPTENMQLEIKHIPQSHDMFVLFWHDIISVINEVTKGNRKIQKHWKAIADIIDEKRWKRRKK